MNSKMAFLNLFRHRTRSLLSLMTIAGAIVSIVVFRGFSSYILEELRKFGVENQFGHLQVGQQKLWSPTNQKLKDQLHSLSDPLKAQIEKLPELKSLSPRLSLQALVSHGDTQFGAQLIGYSPEKELEFKPNIRLIEGDVISSPQSLEIILGSGLQTRLKVRVGETVSIVSQTVDGVVNAMDLTVSGVFQTTVAEVDNQTAFVSLKTAQGLLDTDKVAAWVIRLKDLEQTFSVQDRLKLEVQKLQPELTVKSWRELADLYNQVEEFYGVQNFIIQTILSTLTILAILNTVGMTVYERTGEIGTLRSLGLQRSGIILQFLTEGFFLAMLGAIIGSVLAVIVVIGINQSGFATAIPGASTKVPIKALLEPSAFVIAIGLGCMSTLIGTIVPSWRASRLTIVDALRRNI